VNPFQYTARESDPETGLYYYRARYYDPAAGRFLSEDPIRFFGGHNFYRYVRNGPTDFRDPLGLCGSGCGAKALLGGLAHVAVDAIGLVPGGGAVSAVANDGEVLFKGFEASASAASTAFGAFDTSPGGLTATGLGVTATAINVAKLAEGVSEAIPVIGQVVAAVSIIVDIYNAVQDYRECAAGSQ